MTMPQVGRDGLLQGGHVVAVDLDLRGQLVEVVVAGDDRLGEREVGVEQRLGGLFIAEPTSRGHLDEDVADLVELLVETSRMSSSCVVVGPRASGGSTGRRRVGGRIKARSGTWRRVRGERTPSTSGEHPCRG